MDTERAGGVDTMTEYSFKVVFWRGVDLVVVIIFPTGNSDFIIPGDCSLLSISAVDEVVNWSFSFRDRRHMRLMFLFVLQ